MSLNKKTFIFITALIAAAMVGVVIASRTIVLDGYLNLEKTQLNRNLDRSLHTLNSLVSELETFNRDWANWDDAYTFVQDKNEIFKKSTLNDETLFNAKLNLVVFLDNEGRIVFSKSYNLVEQGEIPLPASLKSHLTRSDLLVTHIGKESISGLINSSEGMMMVSSYPILRSDGSGPSRGTLIMGRYIGNDVIKKLSDILQLPVSFTIISDTRFAGGDYGDDELIIADITNDRITGYKKVFDIYRNSDILIGVEMPREIYAQGTGTMAYFLLATLLIGSIVITGGIYFQNKSVLAPIYRLSDELKTIRGNRDLSSRVKITSRDEIGRLGADINAMLASLQEFNQEIYENEKRLSEKVGIIENQNKDLEKTKAAMMNLLEDERQLEATLKKEHDRLNLIISSMGEGLLVIDKDYKITMINPIAQNLLEVKAEDVIGKKWSEITTTLKNHSETPVEERSFSKAVKEGETTITNLDDNHWYKTKAGQTFPIISITVPLKVEGKIVGAVKVFRDATQERQSRELIEKEVTDRTRELWEERARMFASINSLHMGFIIADTTHNIIVKNPAVSELLKIDDRDVNFERLSEELKANLDLKALGEKCLQEKTSFAKDDIYYKDKFLRIFLTPVIPEAVGQVSVSKAAIGYVLLIEDVTTGKQLERAKDEFFAVASHELRTPLTAIRGNTSMIIDYFAEKIQDTDLKEMISDMHESSIRLINIVNDFLDASRLEQGKVEFKKEEFDIVGVMKGVVNELDDFAKQKGLFVKLEDPGKVILVTADKARVQQIGNNLLGNAIKFTKTGGVTFSFDQNADFTVVKVTDSGVGISPANQGLLFKKFQQAGERVLARDVTKGTGMGLYISKLLTEGMGGKIYLGRSELGKGSTFVFELPLK